MIFSLYTLAIFALFVVICYAVFRLLQQLAANEKEVSSLNEQVRSEVNGLKDQIIVQISCISEQIADLKRDVNSMGDLTTAVTALISSIRRESGGSSLTSTTGEDDSILAPNSKASKSSGGSRVKKARGKRIVPETPLSEIARGVECRKTRSSFPRSASLSDNESH
jgi:uncharacterized protein YoxC